MNTKLIFATGSLVGLAIGTAAGYFAAKNRLEAQYAQFASEEIETARAYMKMLYKADENSTPEKVLERRVAKTPSGVDNSVHEGPPTEVLERVLDKLRYGKPGVPVSEPVKKNVFSEEPLDDEVEETEDGGDKVIEIISVAEFNLGEKNYAQATLTYFGGDDTLCDEDDMPIDDVDAIVGNGNLDRFGYKSRDARIVYIRNNRLQIDYTVCKSDGTYAEEVAGFVEPKPRKVDKFKE